MKQLRAAGERGRNVRELNVRVSLDRLGRETHPACPAYPGGQLCGQLAAGRNVPSMPRRHRKTVRAARTPPQRHHPPGIRNSQSESYAEIDTDSLRTTLRALCANLILPRAGDPPGLSSIPGGQCGSVQVATFNCQTVLPLPRARRRTVKPFEQQELHATVTIRPELKIPNQIVTQK